MKRTIYIAMAVSLLFAGETLFSADRGASRGYVTGSLESNTNYYVEDASTKATVPDGKFGSNNYLKVDYYNDRFSAGVQMEAYAPVLLGFSSDLKGAALTNYYLSWTDDDFSVTAGTFYDQFGSGLLFRAWEDRALGLNNALTGARVSYNFQDILSVKALWGMPRYGMKFSGTQVKGADLSFVVSNLAGWNNTYLAVEGSVMDRYEALDDDMRQDGCMPNCTGWSGRVNLESNGFFFKGEYVDAGTKYFYDLNYAGSSQMYHRKKGNAQLIETGYNARGLGVNMTLRRLEWMGSKVLNEGTSVTNLLNYVPAMCTQYTYMLTTINPYSSQTGDIKLGFENSGEIGGQLDVFYNFRRGTALGGKRGMKVHANFSTYYTIAQEGTFKPGNLLFRDMSVDVEKQWSKKFKTILLYSSQKYNESYGATNDFINQNIVVADMLYKWTKTFSTKLELQYLQTKQDKGDWMAALVEVNFAPHWSVYGSDMFNHGSTKIHYYNGGVSYTKSRTRLALGYGRYKSGFICSGGVCRTIPAYTGASLTLTTSF
jgi:hypothetical protein